MRTLRTLSALPLTLAFALAAPALAAAQRTDGFELTVVGERQAVHGEPFHLAGTAYEVRGLADLRPLAGGAVRARLIDRRGQAEQVVVETRTRADRDGTWSLNLPIPERVLAQPRLDLVVEGDGESRTFHHGIALRSPLAIDALADRRRYEPGETAHLWMRVRRARDGAPASGRTLHVTVHDASGDPIVDRRLTTGDSGAVTLEVPLEDGAREGTYRAAIRLDDSVAGAQGSVAFQVARRTVERLFVDVDLDDRIVTPGGRLRGAVRVTTPSGTAVSGATVVLSGEGIQEATLQTGADGRAPFRMPAPAHLAGDMENRALAVRVEHPAHGTLHAAAPFLLSRVRWRVVASAEAAGLVPGVATEAYLSVTDARGEPPPEGTVVTVKGPGLRGEAQGATDAHGLLTVPVTVRQGDFGPIAAPSPCAGRAGVHLDATLATDPPAFSQVCVPVSADAELLIRVEEPFAAPGGEVGFTIERGPTAEREVLVEAFAAGRLVATARTGGNRGSLSLPESVGGVVMLRARPVEGVGRPAPVDERGEVAHGVGAEAAVVVRPPDAFTLELKPERDPYLVRDEARVTAQLSQASPQAWIAYVARDLAAHGGEQPWSLEWLGRSLDRALVAPEEGDQTLIRAALAALVQPDAPTNRPRPIVVPPWGLPDQGPVRGRPEVLRDALSHRAEMLRRGAAQAMVAMERAVAARMGDRDQLERLLEKRGNRWVFREDAPERARVHTQNLGGEQITTSMLKSADPGFSFDSVARRIARERLVMLLVALKQLTDPDDQSAARAVAGQPPERWLSRLVELGALSRDALVDPWGGVFTFRRTARPELVLSARAPEWELASPGPDGRLGTGDDVTSPFARILAEGTPYAVASGEDALLRRLSTLSPGPATLQHMARAYATMSLEAAQERTRGPVTGTVSEADGNIGDMLDQAVGGSGESAGFAGLGLRGTGRGGGGMAPPPSAARRSRQAPMEEMAEAEASMDDDRFAREEEGRLAQGQTRAPTPFASLGNRIRERFPATLHFEGGRPLDGAAATLAFDLADALTTYRVEAIAWTASGWTTTASAEVRVDQQATVDAPVPPFATVGDRVRLPVRVDNRSGEPLDVRIRIEGEGVSLAAEGLEPLAVPAHEARELVVPITVGEVGEGHVVVRAVSASGEPLDAVRRPLKVWPDARVVERQLSTVVEGEGTLDLTLPADATPRGSAQLRIVPGEALFGPLSERGLPGAWALVALGEAAPAASLETARQVLQSRDPRPERRIHFDPRTGAMALAVAWGDSGTPGVVLDRGLRALADRVPTGDSEGALRHAATVLLALAPTAEPRNEMGLGELRDGLVERLVSQLAAVVRSEDAALMAVAAAALAMSDSGEAHAQANELLRRLRREEVRFDDQSFVEGVLQRGEPAGRLGPTADVALAYAALGERERALRFVRHLVRSRPVEGTPGIHGAVAAGRLGGRGTSRVTARLDGSTIELGGEPPIRSASFPTPAAGEHSIAFTVDGVALVVVDLRYARPWDAAPEREARFDVTLDGEVGARDVRAGLALTIRSRQPRLVPDPVAYVDLPAGAELDQPTREALEAVGAEPTMEGRTLRLALPPLTPGRHVRLPLPLRWSVGGALRGLGVTVRDEGEPSAEIQPSTVLPSRVIELPDEGPEPEAPEAEMPPPPIEPPPEPIPYLEPMRPVARLLEAPMEVRS